MINPSTRNDIRRLRALGMTYVEISNELNSVFPKSTLSYICKDVKLPDEYHLEQKKRIQLNLESARKKALIVNKKKLHQRLETIRIEAEKVAMSDRSIDQEKVALAMLYIGEGSKYKSYRGLALGSSDIEILQTYIALLERCYHKQREDFRARIQHRSDQSQEGLLAYWSQGLGLSVDTFYASYIDKRTTGKPTRNPDYKGVCVISCSGADIQLELDAIARLYGQKLWGVSSSG